MVPEGINFANLMPEGANFKDYKQSYLIYVVNKKFSSPPPRNFWTKPDRPKLRPYLESAVSN